MDVEGAVSPLVLSISGLSKAFGTTEVLSGISFDVVRGEFLSIFGPNGCGKTTLLSIIGGIIEPDHGGMSSEPGRTKDEPGGGVGMVFQDYDKTLLPWRSCIDNIALALEANGVRRRHNRARVRRLLDDLEIELPLTHFPYEMSGGQKQLTCIARALANHPQLLLLDEPFASLDYQTRLAMHTTMQRICERTGVTTVFVSHEIDEAVFLADRVLLLTRRPARIASIFDVDLPRPRTGEVYAAPEFVRTRSAVLGDFLRWTSA